MKPITLVFQIHHPCILRLYRFFDIGNNHYYYDDFANESSIRKMAVESYLPANQLLQTKIESYKGKLKVAFQITGSTLELFRRYAPEVLESFKQLAKTNQVEFLGSTATDSIASLCDLNVFEKQIKLHKEIISEITDQKSQVFANAGMIYSDEIGAEIARQGYKAAIIDSGKQVLGWRSPNQIYGNTLNPDFKLFVRNSLLSNWLTNILTGKTEGSTAASLDNFLMVLASQAAGDRIVNLYFSYSILCATHPRGASVFRLFDDFLGLLIHSGKITTMLPSEAVSQFSPVSSLSVPNPVTFDESEHGISLWTGNELQQEALDKLFDLSGKVWKNNDNEIMRDWNNLQSVSHFYGMSSYRNENMRALGTTSLQPYEIFINYMNILSDLELRLDTRHNAGLKAQISHLKQKVKEKESLIKAYRREIKALKNKKKR